MIELYIEKKDFPKVEMWIFSLGSSHREESICLKIKDCEAYIIYDSIQIKDKWMYIIRNSL